MKLRTFLPLATTPALLLACAEPEPSGPLYMRTAHGVLEVEPVYLDDDRVLVMGDIKMRREHFESYLVAPEDLETEIARTADDNLRGAVRAAGSFRWPNGVVPFQIMGELTDEEEDWVNGAIAHWEEVTPFRFVVRTNQTDFVRFIRGDGCSSENVGRIGGMQQIEVSGCAPDVGDSTWGNVAHEIGHAVGFFHEQTRSDRDTYVTINDANIRAATSTENCPHQFKTFMNQGRDGQNVGPYDYGSIMHYPRRACAIDNAVDTITPRQAGVTIGQANALSLGDRYAAYVLYSGHKLVSTGPQATLYRDASYQGISQSFLPGFYETGLANDFLATIGQDQATSLRVPVGLAVKLCAHNIPDLGGCYWYTTDTAQLPAAIDNAASAVDVERAVVVYRDQNLTGVRQTLRRGNHLANAGQLATVGNDQISSLHVPPGLVAELCLSESGSGSTGTNCQTFEGNVNFVGTFMDNRASIVRVKSAATLWQESKNWGNRKSLTAGTYNSTSSWSPVNGITSVSVGEYLQVRLCDGSDGGGPCQIFKGDVQYIGPDLNDKVSYVRVETAQ